MNQTEFAKRIGVSPAAVSKYIKTGKIKKAVTKVKGRRDIKFRVAVRELKQNLDPINQKAKDFSGRKVAKKKAPAKKAAKKKPASKTKTAGDYTSHRTESERIKSELKGLELAKAKGEVLLRVDVEKGAFECARATRDQLMGIPDRLDSVLAAETDPHKINRLLTAEIKQALGVIIGTLSRKTSRSN